MTAVIAPALAIAFAYAALGVAYGRRLRAGNAAPAGWLRLCTAAVAGAHAVLLAGTLPQASAMDLSFGNAVSLTAALVILAFVAVSLFQAVDGLGALLLPAAAGSVLLALLPEPAQPLALTASPPLLAHVLLSLIAYSLLALAALQALLLAYQDRHLRAHDPGPPVRALPPLWDMERLLFRLIGWGFTALSLALATGLLFLDDAFAPPLLQKTALSLVAWTVFGVLLIGRRRAGWRGRTAARFALAGFGLLLAAYLGSKLLAELLA